MANLESLGRGFIENKGSSMNRKRKPIFFILFPSNQVLTFSEGPVFLRLSCLVGAIGAQSL
jgi:hypothetical protein